jgi:hypothetical protein
MKTSRRISLGYQPVQNSGANYVFIRFPKASLDALGIVPGMEMECFGFLEPTEIIIRPRLEDAVSCEGYIEQSITLSKKWELRDED